MTDFVLSRPVIINNIVVMRCCNYLISAPHRSICSISPISVEKDLFNFNFTLTSKRLSCIYRSAETLTEIPKEEIFCRKIYVQFIDQCIVLTCSTWHGYSSSVCVSRHIMWAVVCILSSSAARWLAFMC